MEKKRIQNASQLIQFLIASADIVYCHVPHVANNMHVSVELALQLMHFIGIICLKRLIFFPFCALHQNFFSCVCVCLYLVCLFVCLLKQSIVSLHLQYYLNVCRPLVPQYGLSCNANSAACRAILNGTKNPEQEQVNAFESIIRCQFCAFCYFLSAVPFLRCLSMIFFPFCLCSMSTPTQSLIPFSIRFIQCELSIFFQFP